MERKKRCWGSGLIFKGVLGENAKEWSDLGSVFRGMKRERGVEIETGPALETKYFGPSSAVEPN